MLLMHGQEPHFFFLSLTHLNELSYAACFLSITGSAFTGPLVCLPPHAVLRLTLIFAVFNMGNG
jgi:hypothetical protein